MTATWSVASLTWFLVGVLLIMHSTPLPCRNRSNIHTLPMNRFLLVVTRGMHIRRSVRTSNSESCRGPERANRASTTPPSSPPSFDPSRSLQVSLPQLLTAFRIYFQVHVVSSPCPYSLSPSLICAVLFPSVFPLHTSSIPIRGCSETSFDLSCSLNPPNPISPRPSSSPKDSAPALVFSHITSLTAMFFPV